jgi:hypothetical protein
LLSAVLFYVAVLFYAKSYNAKLANRWFDAHLPILEQQFSKPTNGGLTQDGYSDFFNFSTGRRGLSSMHTIFTLRPRHDFLQWAFQVGRTFVDLQYRPRDEIQLDFKLLPGSSVPDCVWAVVAKDELLSIKDKRWDLTFTRTTENASLPTNLSVMSEFADVTDSLFKQYGTFSLAKALSDPAILPYFRSLSVTDQPRYRPTTGPLAANEREKHLILSLTVPPPAHAAVTAPLVSAVFTLVDCLAKVSLRPETRIKLKKTREDLDKNLKDEAESDKKEEAVQALEDKKAAKRKAEEERVSRLSAVEQKKVIERERKRSIRKQQGKVVKK